MFYQTALVLRGNMLEFRKCQMVDETIEICFNSTALSNDKIGNIIIDTGG